MEKFINADRHYSCISALLLMHDGTTCIAGASDGSLVYWNLPLAKSGNRVRKDSAHNEWICDLTAIDNTIYSCSLDWSVKSWMLTNTGSVHQTSYMIDLPGVPMCVSSCPDQRSLFATGTYCQTILVFDLRSHKLIKQYRPHTGAVRNLAMNTDYILSASEDKTVSVWDQRAGRTMKSITIPDEGFPACMSMQRDWVFVGDSNAKCHMLNLKNDFELVKSYSTEHTEWISGVYLTHGCLITTSSMDGTVRISSPMDPPKSFATLHSGFGEIHKMDYLNDTLAISNRSKIVVWRPKSKKYQ